MNREEAEWLRRLEEKVDAIMSNHLPHIYAEQIKIAYRHKLAAIVGVIGFLLLLAVPDSSSFWESIGGLLSG